MTCSDTHPVHGQCESTDPYHSPDYIHSRSTYADGRKSTWYWHHVPDGATDAFFKQRCVECRFEFTHICPDGTRYDHGDDQHLRHHEAHLKAVAARERLFADIEEHLWSEWLAAWGGIGEAVAVNAYDREHPDPVFIPGTAEVAA